MGRYARREEGLRALLTAHEGWKAYREMTLFEALTFFEGGSAEADRLGAARAHLALAELFHALDRLFLETEATYLGSPEGVRAPEDAGRLGLVLLRRGEHKKAASVFDRPAPEGLQSVWAVGRAGILAQEGRVAEAREAVAAAAPHSAEDRVLALVACHLWGVPWDEGASGVYPEAVASFRRGDLAAGVMALQMLEFASDGVGADPELFVYPLMERAFGGLALAALEGLESPGAHFHRGRARSFVGDLAGAADSFAATAPGTEGAGDAAWLFSPYVGPGEAVGVAAVLGGRALYRLGRRQEALELWRGALRDQPGPLVRATLAACQAVAGVSEPLGDSVKTAEAALAEVEESLAGLPGDDETALLVELYPARVAAVARLVGRVLRRAGHRDRALEVLEGAHRKSSGYRPDFVNPPSYLAEIALAYSDTGQYSSAVGVLFELASEYPSGRLAYESAKRLYASRSGGAAPPR